MSGTPKRTVLVVDDDAGMRELLTRWLEADGYHAVAVEHAQAALLAIEAMRPAVVLCDMALPGPDGGWLVQQLRAQHPEIAVVLATANHEVPPTLSLRPGVVGYLTKPFRRDLFRHVVQQAVVWHTERPAAATPQPDAAVEAWLNPTGRHD